MSNYDAVLKLIASAIRQELIDQGHYIAPGGLADDIETKVKESLDSVELEIYMRNYAQYINRGVRPENVPFSGVTGSGGRSAYIEGLIKFAERRGFDNPKSAAFAIAQKHKQEGIPTRASEKFSKTGARTAFLEAMEKKNIDKITTMIEKIQGESVNLHVINLIKKYGDPRSNMAAN